MITLEKINKTFDTRGIAGIHDVSASIKKGEIIALMGPNGSGKTTLLNILLQKISTDSGTISIKGKVSHFNSDIKITDENVQKHLINSIQLEIEDEKKIQLSRDFAQIFEFTYQLRQKLSELSQGQLQKVLISRELINGPEIILLDEPFTHLDPMSRSQILQDLFEFIRTRELTVIWVTHEKDEALRFADKIMLLQHGKLEQFSSPIEFTTTPRNLFVAQFLGHTNFISFKAINGLWNSPWGEIKTSLDQGYFIIPPNGWVLDESSSFKARIQKITIQNFHSEIEFIHDERLFITHFPIKTATTLKTGGSLSLKAKIENCLLIPL